MTTDKKTAAIFDLDGTLFTGHFWQGIVKHHIKHRVKLPSVAAYLTTHIPLWLASKVKILSEETYKVRWGEDLAATLRGLRSEEMRKIFEWVSSNYVMKLLRPDIMALLGRHRKEGHATVILSGGFNDFLEIIKQRLGVDHAVGTKIEVVEDICSGRIVRPMCFGINKARLLEEYISQAKLNINFGLSFAYADSIVDIPVLEMVGNPVATYPDKKLLSVAQHKGWKILPVSINVA